MPADADIEGSQGLHAQRQVDGMLGPSERIVIGRIGIGDMTLGLPLDLQPGIIGGNREYPAELYLIFPFDAMGLFFVVIEVLVREIIEINTVFRFAMEPGRAGIEHCVTELDTPFVIHGGLRLKTGGAIRRVQLIEGRRLESTGYAGIYFPVVVDQERWVKGIGIVASIAGVRIQSSAQLYIQTGLSGIGQGAVHRGLADGSVFEGERIGARDPGFIHRSITVIGSVQPGKSVTQVGGGKNFCILIFAIIIVFVIGLNGGAVPIEIPDGGVVKIISIEGRIGHCIGETTARHEIFIGIRIVPCIRESSVVKIVRILTVLNKASYSQGLDGIPGNIGSDRITPVSVIIKTGFMSAVISRGITIGMSPVISYIIYEVIGYFAI